MVKEHALTVSLEEFGLSKYEARAYVTLISKGTLSASELAYYAELPRTKVYPILLKLEKKKLVIISKRKPITCTAIAPEDAFDGVIHKQINKVNAMNTLVTNLKQVSEESKKARGSEEKRYFHLNTNNVLEQLRLMIEGSKYSINIMVDQWGLNLLSECKEQLLRVLRRDLDVKVVVPPTLIGTESFRKIPDGANLRMSDIIQNCLIFDQTEILIIDNENGKGSVFSSADVLARNQTIFFNHIWKNAMKTESLADLTKTEAQEVCRIINVINQNGLGYVLRSALSSKNNDFDLLQLLEKNGINLKSKTFTDMLELIDSSLQVTCSGHVNYDANHKNITIESKMNGGHSLPWASLLDRFLQRQGYKTRIVVQNNSNKGELVHIKFNSKQQN